MGVAPVSRAMTSSARRRISSGVGRSDAGLSVPGSALMVSLGVLSSFLTVGDTGGSCVGPGSVAFLERGLKACGIVGGSAT